MTPDLKLQDGILTVYKELDFDYDVQFDRACTALVHSENDNLVIDLSRVKHITSACIGTMAALYIQAEANKKKLSVLAQGHVLKSLRMAGFDNLMKVTDSGRFKARTAHKL